MSPLAPAGTRGYTDGQRVQNWDSGQLYGHALQLVPNLETTPWLDVSRYAYLAGLDFCSDASMEVALGWAFDSAGATICGVRDLMLNFNIANVAQYRILNLGPYVQASWSSPGGAFHHQVELFATNRVHPLEFIPQGPVLSEVAGVAVPATSSVFVHPTDYYAGPTMIGLRQSVAGFAFLDYLDLSGAWVAYWTAALVANVWQFPILPLPPGAWRMQFQNTTAGAGTCDLRVIPSMSGAM